MLVSFLCRGGVDTGVVWGIDWGVEGVRYMQPAGSLTLVGYRRGRRERRQRYCALRQGEPWRDPHEKSACLFV